MDPDRLQNQILAFNSANIQFAGEIVFHCPITILATFPLQTLTIYWPLLTVVFFLIFSLSGIHHPSILQPINLSSKLVSH